MIWDVLVHPSKVAQFEEALKNQVALYGEAEFPYSWFAASTEDFHYYFGIQVEDHAAVDQVFAAFEKIKEKLGADWDALHESFAGTEESLRVSRWNLRRDLSYTPEKARLKPEQMAFTEWSFVYFTPGTEAKAGKNAKRWRELYESKGAPDGFDVWVGGLGTESPAYCWVGTGKSPGDYFTSAGETEKLLGEETEPLWKEMLTILKRYERKLGKGRPELAFTAKTKEAAE